MSGGHFDYQQYRLNDIATMIDELIASNDDPTLDEFGNRRGHGYNPSTLTRFKVASHALKKTATMVQQIDWLVSGDDGEDTFLRRWAKDVDGDD